MVKAAGELEVGIAQGRLGFDAKLARQVGGGKEQIAQFLLDPSGVAGLGRLGDLVEFGATTDLFMKPKKRDTEDYITGRFG